MKGEYNDRIGRYLASIQSGPFIKELSANKEIAHTCLTYLLFTCFDLSITEEEMDDAILDGHFTLQAYATTHWLDHVKEGIQGDMDSKDFMRLCQKISMFLMRRANQNFDRKSMKEESVLELKQLEKNQKHIYRELCYINSSLASELSESLKPSKNNSESLSSYCAARNSAFAG